MYYSTTEVKKEQEAETDNKMPSDSSDRRLAKPPHMGAQPPPEHEHLPCPRCDSTNTKFCYYNNYNLSQPRHFCKACRRYWTQGGTLRNIPVGGGTRKNTKRSRSSSTTSATHEDPLVSSTNPMISMFPASYPDFSVPVSGSFTSLLNTQGPPGFLALGGFGLGLGSGFEDMSFGMGNKGVWPFTDSGESGGGGGITSSGGVTVGNSWQLGNGESGLVEGDCFAWPELAISTPGKSIK